MNWSADERRILLSVQGLGEGVVERLSEVGVASFDDLNRLGIDEVLEQICRRVGTQSWKNGTQSWKNRRRALQRALDLRLAIQT